MQNEDSREAEFRSFRQRNYKRYGSGKRASFPRKKSRRSLKAGRKISRKERERVRVEEKYISRVVSLAPCSPTLKTGDGHREVYSVVLELRGA